MYATEASSWAFFIDLQRNEHSEVYHTFHWPVRIEINRGYWYLSVLWLHTRTYWYKIRNGKGWENRTVLPYTNRKKILFVKLQKYAENREHTLHCNNDISWNASLAKYRLLWFTIFLLYYSNFIAKLPTFFAKLAFFKLYANNFWNLKFIPGVLQSYWNSR